MAWGQLQIGALVLKETDILQDVTNANTGERSVRVSGAETNPGASLAELEAKQEDIMALINRVFPVSFERKTNYDGYYRFDDTNTEFEKWVEGPAQIRWGLSMTLIGTDNSVDIESRLANVVRGNDFTLLGERWHAPSIGHLGYHTGTTLPSIVTRTGSGGPMVVYRSIPAGVNPRWSVPVSAFNGGRARLLAGGVERVGTGIRASGVGWELNNGLVRVKPGGDTILVGAYSGGTWRDKSWGVFFTSSLLVPTFDQMTVLRNDSECVVIRLMEDLAPGSAMLDLTLRRGSRFVEGYMQRSNSADELKVRLTSAEASTDNHTTGYVTASANDADGNRYVAGSSRGFTMHVNGGVVRANAATMDFFLGAVVGGGSAVSGDTAVNLRDQYIGAMPERTGVSAR